MSSPSFQSSQAGSFEKSSKPSLRRRGEKDTIGNGNTPEFSNGHF